MEANRDLHNSFQKTLSGEQKARNYATERKPIQGLPENCQMHEGVDDTLLLVHLLRIPTADEPVPREGKGELTQAKNFIRGSLPVGRYIGQLNLQSGGFKELQVVDL